MSEPLSKVKILLDSENSEGLHLVILDCESRKYMSAKIFSAEEHDISLLWSNLPKNGIEIYEQIHIDYKELFPKFEEFIQFSPRKNVNEGEKFEEFVNYSEALVFRSEEHQRFTSDNLPPTIKSVEKNEVVSELGYNDCAPVQSSRLYTSEMQHNLHDLNSEIEIEMYLNSLLNTENDI
ncbi:hypothetical protein RhiirA5_408800 [Rhizophagus irregularis]|uniref:Uncharacterized protein n=1 Tax=Rhizophagus irregularis TaxID=588596 RepID=A0A2I1E2H1_9GLOM|nr:hypothetical protein RhiirA5_408800 [Rhizophagus irregularis]PKY16301.1 hypothetical protein RhiirB3_428644 [Rhizophagus irregularis]CAB5372682.1 unnamed protein product [Rhizophagus irregularis]